MSNPKEIDLESQPIIEKEKTTRETQQHHTHPHHSHSHGHAHGHGHFHGEDSSERGGRIVDQFHFRYSQKQKYFIVFFTWLMPTNAGLLDPLKDNDFEYYFSKYFFIIIYILEMLSYYRSIVIKNNFHKKPPPVPDSINNNYFDPIYLNNKDCPACEKSWKPIRCHHCRICNSCNIKMDHHCPWTVNCVGLRNHKAFYLFTIGAAVFCYRSLYYLIYCLQNGIFLSHSFFFLLYWFFTSVIIGPVGFGLFMLSIYHSMLAISNVTTLEQMGGANIGILNILQLKKPTKDFGQICLVFLGIPICGGGTRMRTTFPMNPLPNLTEYRKKCNLPSANLKEVDPEKYIKECEDKCKDFKLLINGEIFIIKE